MESYKTKGISRRDFLKIFTTGSLGLALAGNTVGIASASSSVLLPADQQKALLYDATLCSGCKECELACKRYNKLPDEKVDDLTGNTLTLIKRYSSEDGQQVSFRKYQCMHCVEPACAASCPVGALHKLEDGPVVYDSYKCIGCRYCMQACPFGVPRYDWSLSYPLIRKCELCYLREAGPACAEVCPKQSLIYGQRGDLLEIAKNRIQANPGKYYQDRVYGEFEAGGTSFLILSAVAFENLGLPIMDDKALPDRTQWAINIVPLIFLGVGGTMSAIYKYAKEKQSNNGKEES